MPAPSKPRESSAAKPLPPTVTNSRPRQISRPQADLAALETRMTANLYRAFWFQGGAIIAILTALRFLPL